jgi:hypothetical protein
VEAEASQGEGHVFRRFLADWRVEPRRRPSGGFVRGERSGSDLCLDLLNLGRIEQAFEEEQRKK